MSGYRIALYGASGAILAALLYASGYFGLALCAPAPLPGDGLWSWRNRLFEAFATVAGHAAECVNGSGAGRDFIALAQSTPLLLKIAIGAALVCETLGRAARRAWWLTHGSHAVLVGNVTELAALAAEQGRDGSRCFIAANVKERKRLARRFPFAEIARADGRGGTAGALRALGADRARFIAAASRDDLLNNEVMRAALASTRMAARKLMVRLEAPELRVLFADELRRLAGKRGADLAVVSVSRMQIRAGQLAAMPGRYTVEGATGCRFALCGDGPLLQGIAFHIARQGFGLENAVPELAILRLGQSDFTSGALERLMAAEMAIRVRPMAVDSANTLALERAMAALALAEPPLSAIHCTSLALAQRFESVIMRLDKPVPPIVAYDARGDVDRPSALVRRAAPPDLVEAEAAIRLRDARAIAVHNAYASEQKALKGARFGELPGETTWDSLPEYLQDDNRAVADHIGYKLARIGFVVRQGMGASDAFAKDEIEMLARIEHARWLAAKAVEGWRHADKRDNQALLHPSMLPFEALSEAERDKDRAVAMLLPAQLAAAGEHARRTLRVAVLPEVPGCWDAASLDAALARFAAMPLTCIVPADAALAGYLNGRGHEVEVLVTGPVDGPRADRIRVVTGSVVDAARGLAGVVIFCDADGTARVEGVDDARRLHG